ncbi:MAG: hypothetical protein HYX76_03950 [Acidobacteria bacterium]|nr:hypothetical protein [Acidobacteriota bacterium]
MKYLVKLALMVFMLAGFVSAASAQGPAPRHIGFFSLNGGTQSHDEEFGQGGTFSIYLETGSISTSHKISGGSILDVGAGVWVWKDLAIGFAVNTFKDKEDITVGAQIPNPLFFDQPRTTSVGLKDLKHKQRAVHLQAIYFFPITSEFDVAFSVGPSFFKVKQDLVSDLGPANVSEGAFPFTSVSLANVGVVTHQETATGFNIGADASYMVTRWVGGGFFMRFARAKVDLPLGGGQTKTIDAGGFQVGGGVRVRF